MDLNLSNFEQSSPSFPRNPDLSVKKLKYNPDFKDRQIEEYQAKLHKLKSTKKDYSGLKE